MTSGTYLDWAGKQQGDWPLAEELEQLEVPVLEPPKEYT